MNDISKAYRLSINACLIFDKCLLFFDDCLSIFDKLLGNNILVDPKIIICIMSKIVDEKRDNIVRCDSCGKLIQYSQEDKKGDYESTPFGTIHWEYINCPNCGHEIQF